MKYVKLSLLFLVIVAVTSCGPKEKGVIKKVIEKVQEKPATILPLDKGYQRIYCRVYFRDHSCQFGN